MNIRLRLIRARPNFYMTSDNPTLVLEFVIFHFTLVVMLSRLTITRNEVTSWPTILWSSNFWKVLQRFSSILPDETTSFRKTFSTMLQFNGVLLQWIQTLYSLYHNIENSFRYQEIDLRQSRKLRGGQPIVDFDVADKCCLYVKKMTAMNFQDDILSNPIDNFRD